MSCYQSASAVIRGGTTGYLLVVKVKMFAGIVPPTLEKGKPPFDPKDVFTVTIVRSVPSSATQVELEVTQNLSRKDEFNFVEIFCGDTKPGTRIAVTKK
ncbi:MAG: hypothetical protein ACTHM5_02260 [Ginsengibacter sp.]